MIKNNFSHIENVRREYTQGGLRRTDLTTDPLALFGRWLTQACNAKIADPTAMCLATVDASQRPFQRIVLLKHYDDKGLVFYTNTGSRKALQLAHNPNVSLLFPWHMLDRQVIFQGEVAPLSASEVSSYFSTRPKNSQIAAWASRQSAPVASRSVLDNHFLELQQKFQHQEVPVPDFWGGFRVHFYSVEFWQGGEHRLHDRFIYQRDLKDWKITRLAP
jgi:pyridoxamine 5'-phosphate oxidase